MLLNIFRAKTYIDEQWFKQTLKRQRETNARTIGQLHNLGVEEDHRLKLQFFFCTNASTKARKLARALQQLGYQADQIDKVINYRIWVVSGWTGQPVKMDVRTVTRWTTLMNHLGHEYDCAFDGWGAQTE